MRLHRIPPRVLLITILLFLAAGITQNALAQTGITLAVLIPHRVVIDPALLTNYDSTQSFLTEYRERIREVAEMSGVADSPDSMARLMNANSNKAYDHFSLGVLPSYMAQMTYMYLLSGTHVTVRKDIYVYLQIDSSAGAISDLRAKAALYGCRFVAGFPELRFQRDGDVINGTLRGQLYDALLDSIVIDDFFQGNDQERKSAFECQPGSLMCVVNNSIMPFIERSSYYLMDVLKKQKK